MPPRVHAPAAERFLYADDDHAGVHPRGIQRRVRTRNAQRRTGHSKIRFASDGAKFLLILLKIVTVFSPLRVFVPISLVAFLVGTMYGVWNVVANGRIPNGAVLLILFAALVLLVGLVSEQVSSLRFSTSVSTRERED